MRDGPPSEAARRDRIDRAIDLLVDHQLELAAALDEDFSGRAYEQTVILDVYAAIEQLKYCRRHLRRWMRRRRVNRHRKLASRDRVRSVTQVSPRQS